MPCPWMFMPGGCCGTGQCTSCPNAAASYQVVMSGVTDSGVCNNCATFNQTWTVPGVWMASGTNHSDCVWRALPATYPKTPSTPCCTVQYTGGYTQVIFGNGPLDPIAMFQIAQCPPKSGDSLVVPFSTFYPPNCCVGWPGSVTLLAL